MSYSILLIVKKPVITGNWKVDNPATSSYQKMGKDLQELSEHNEAVLLLGEGAVRIRLDKGLQGIAEVLARVGSLPYTYIIFSQEIQLFEGLGKA